MLSLIKFLANGTTYIWVIAIKKGSRRWRGSGKAFFIRRTSEEKIQNIYLRCFYDMNIHNYCFAPMFIAFSGGYANRIISYYHNKHLCLPQPQTIRVRRRVPGRKFQPNPICRHSEMFSYENTTKFCFLDILTEHNACMSHSWTILTRTGTFLSFPNPNG